MEAADQGSSPQHMMSVALCGGSEMYLSEAERAFHDAACVISTLIQNPVRENNENDIVLTIV